MLRSTIIAIAILPLAVLAAAAPPQRAITFSEDVAPIVFNQCAVCHRPGEAAPFSLLSYDDVRKRGQLIANVTARRYMPPWHGESALGAFRDDRRLTDAQIHTIQEWVKAGMPEGDPKKTPELPKYTPGWQLGQPDMVVRMPEAFDIPAGGPDVFRNFAVPLNLKEDKWVKAIEFRPSANASHHALFFLDQTGEAMKMDQEDPGPGFNGMSFIARGLTGALAGGLGGRGGPGQRGQRGQRGTGIGALLLGGNGLGGWAVGGSPHPLPEGLAHALPKDSDLVLQMHFHPIGKVQHEQATIGFYFADGPPKRTLTSLQMPSLFGALAGIDIPAGEKHFVIKDSFVLPIDVDVISAGGQAHYLASDMRMTATLPDGARKDVLHVPNWDFNWQERYYFKDLVRLPKGTRLDVEIAYDNSADNPHNPANPPKRVRFGQQSTDEMGAVTIEIAPVSDRDITEYREAIAGHLQQSVVGLLLNGRGAR